MGRLKGLLNLLVLAVAAVLVWHEYQRSMERAAEGARPPRPAPAAGDDPLMGAIAAIKHGAAQVATAASELVRPEAAESEAPPAATSGGDAGGSERVAAATPAAEPDAPSLPAGAVQGDGSADCPTGFPIKGNASSMIYHRPGTGSYERTVPELCFATDAAAEAAGYRAPRN